jgi:hypothetical protein
MKLVKVRVGPIDVAAMAEAVVQRDTLAIAAQLDAAIVFEGVGGRLIEKVDGPIFEGLAELIVSLMPRLLERVAAWLDSRRG